MVMCARFFAAILCLSADLTAAILVDASAFRTGGAIQVEPTTQAVAIRAGRWQYWVEPRKRRGGFDQFFDLPASHPDGKRGFMVYFEGQRLSSAPRFDDCGQIVTKLREGGCIISTGEVFPLPVTRLGGEIRAHVKWTLPLAMAVVTVSDGQKTEREIHPLDSTSAFGEQEFQRHDSYNQP